MIPKDGKMESIIPKGPENNIYIMMMVRETFYGVKFNISIKRISFGSKDFTKQLKIVECTSFLGQTGLFGPISPNE